IFSLSSIPSPLTLPCGCPPEGYSWWGCVLRNQPIGVPRLDYGDRVKFKRDHIIDIHWDADCLCAPTADDPERNDTLDVDPECNGLDSYLSEPATEDPEHDHIAWVHSGCNGVYEPAAGDPELSPPPESSAT
ncbi:MAG TPA: hypothetical protein VIV12_07755, partial [Streptosporangiaceae bacterium]